MVTNNYDDTLNKQKTLKFQRNITVCKHGEDDTRCGMEIKYDHAFNLLSFCDN